MSTNAGKRVIEEYQAAFEVDFAKQSFSDLPKLLSRLDNVQEQPQALDEYLQGLIRPIVPELLSRLTPEPIRQFFADLCHILYYYSKIRGTKVVVNFLPNAVSLLQPLLTCLELQSASDPSIWHARYILMSWLSLICLAPFSMRTFDSSSDGTKAGSTTVDRIMSVANKYIGASSKEREAAGLLIARLLTRLDLHEHYMPPFLETSLQEWHSDGISLNHRTGLLTCLCEIYKLGNRDILIQHTNETLAALHQLDDSEQLLGNTLLRKLRIKLAQRVALTLLPPIMPNWRCKQHFEAESVPSSSEALLTETPVAVEDIVGLLIDGLSDRDTVVRYSAAKGLGRITGRLRYAFAEEVIQAIIDLLQSDLEESEEHSFVLKQNAQESQWHGVCLALAELARSGAIIPSLLPVVLPIVFIAMKFDIRKGSHSVGTSVRDAACYVMWSMIRCFASEILLPYTGSIATNLIVVAMFDREVSVRRAASAAYQEGVGRLSDPSFPNGIAVLSVADFFAVGQRRTAFLEVAPTVFQHEAYQGQILKYLIVTSCKHWDVEVRELAGHSLRNILTAQSKAFESGTSTASLFGKLLQLLASRLTSIDIASRHGAYYVFGEIAHALHAARPAKEDHASWSDILLEAGSNIPKHNFKGPSSALMYSAVCHYIRYTALYCSSEDTSGTLSEIALTELFEIAASALSVSNDASRSEATEAIRNLCLSQSIRDKVINRIGETSTLSGTSRKGWLTVYGKLQYPDSETCLMQAMSEMILGTRIEGSSRDDPDLRKVSYQALAALMPQIARSNLTAKVQQPYVELFDCLANGLRDYTTDARGDVGSWVREAAVLTTCQLILALPYPAQKIHAAELIELLTLSLTLCLGKIDNLRVAATEELYKSLHTQEGHLGEQAPWNVYQNVLPVLKHASEHLLEGESSTRTFVDMTELLQVPVLRPALLQEYLISGKSGSLSTMQSASEAIAKFLDNQSPEYRTIVLEDVSRIIETSKDDDRVLVPVLDSLANLFDVQIFIDTTFDLNALFAVIQSSTLNSRSISKIMSALRCYAALAGTNHAVRHKAWKKLCLTLGHTFARIRAFAAELLYTVLVNLNLETTEEAEATVEVLTAIDWSMNVNKAQLEVVKDYTLP